MCLALCSGLCRLALARAACWHRVPAVAPCYSAPAPAPPPPPAPCHSAPAPAPVKALSPGMCYILLNAHCETVMDLSASDSTSIIGYPMHGGPNQQWDFIPCGLGYLIRCQRPDNDGHALYLTVDCGGARDHAPVVASAHPVVWSVEQTQQGIIISWPNSNYVFNLADKAACTTIQLMPRNPGQLCQLWRPEERGRVPTASETPAATVCHAAPAFAPGTYYFLSNARGGTVMDLSGADRTSIIGYPKHGGPNQQWEFIPSGHGCFIRGAPPYSGLYLSLDCGCARDGAPVVATTHPVAWNVEKTDTGIIISWPNSQYVFDLANWGDKTPCTKIQLMPLIPGEFCQVWRPTAVAK